MTQKHLAFKNISFDLLQNSKLTFTSIYYYLYNYRCNITFYTFNYKNYKNVQDENSFNNDTFFFKQMTSLPLVEETLFILIILLTLL